MFVDMISIINVIVTIIVSLVQVSESLYIHFGDIKSEVPQTTDGEHHITRDIAKYVKLAQNSADDFNDVYTKIQLALNKFPSKSIVNADNYNASLLNENCNCYCQCPKPKNASHKLMLDIKQRVYALREKIRNVLRRKKKQAAGETRLKKRNFTIENAVVKIVEGAVNVSLSFVDDIIHLEANKLKFVGCVFRNSKAKNISDNLNKKYTENIRTKRSLFLKKCPCSTDFDVRGEIEALKRKAAIVEGKINIIEQKFKSLKSGTFILFDKLKHCGRSFVHDTQLSFLRNLKGAALGHA